MDDRHNVRGQLDLMERITRLHRILRGSMIPASVPDGWYECVGNPNDVFTGRNSRLIHRVGFIPDHSEPVATW